MQIGKVLVANRGEIAVRVLRACADAGVPAAVIHSDADADALHVRLAAESVRISGSSPTQAYLDGAQIMQAAQSIGADAIHPGYGFLSENADFARAVTEAGLTFIGPSADAIALMGDKVAARAVADRADVPTVPGTLEPVNGPQAVAFADQVGFPIAVKASFGGGGRGMRVVSQPSELEDAVESASREATASFGRPEVYLERFLEHARHIEIQILADQHGSTAWLGERDCSIQRRNQKVIEEAPAIGLSDQLRRQMGDAAVRLARAVDYLGAGTVEFLVEGDSFYFLEMNTRIQVEHPITEQVLGIDLVVEQLRIAAGEKLSDWSEPHGHAIELRITAEHVVSGVFMPSPGRIDVLDIPRRSEIRWDAGYEAGDEVSGAFDSLIGKLVITGPDRATAIQLARDAIADMRIDGTHTSIPALARILEHSDFVTGAVSTRWLESDVDWSDEDSVPGRSEVMVGGRWYTIPYVGERSAVEKSTRAVSRPRAGRKSTADSGQLVSPMQGTVISVATEAGAGVASGEVLFIVEAMKMENPVRAPFDGVVSDLRVTIGTVVAAGELLAVVKANS